MTNQSRYVFFSFLAFFFLVYNCFFFPSTSLELTMES